MRKNNIVFIYSQAKQNYLGEHGVYPIWQDAYERTAAYRRNHLLSSLLDRYDIERVAIPNKL